MEAITLHQQNLPLEPDLQNFIGFALTAAGRLGGNVFAASAQALEISAALRAAGAARNYPLPAALLLAGKQLLVGWGDGETQRLADLAVVPDDPAVHQLQALFQQSSEAADAELLRRRNAAMERYLAETRARTEEEIRAMEKILAARQAELWQSLRLAQTDPLTGLLNRRAFDEKIDQAFRRTVRQSNETLSLVLLDLDHFKQVNDEFGHQYGDEYLCRMADALRAVSRQDVDWAFRFGGDEFALLLFADHVASCRKAARILELMAGKVSIGIATVTGGDAEIDLQQFIRSADEALYRAKRAGRGRIFAAQCELIDSEGCPHHCPKRPDLDLVHA